MSYLDQLAAEIAAGRPVAVIKVVAAPADSGFSVGQALVVSPAGHLTGGFSDQRVQADLADLATAMLARGESGIRTVATVKGPLRAYVESHPPSPVLVVVGAGHVGQAIAQVGALAGFAITVIDDRPQFASAARFPKGASVMCGPFPQQLAALGLGPRHYVVLVTRGHRHDMRCLHQVLDAPVAYLGMIGSRRRVETVFGLLQADGANPEQLERIHAPIGLDIGARTPGEIAVAVVAEIIALRRGGTNLSLSKVHRTPIRATAGR